MTDDPLVAKYGLHRGGHALFAPSAAASWLTCSGSLLVNARAGDTAGFDAAQGTVAHLVAEIWNARGKRPGHMIGQKVIERAGGNDHVIEVTSEMLDYVGQFVDWCREVPGEHLFEQRVDLSELLPIPQQGGTADHIAMEHGKLTVTDLKYGTGVRVYAMRNPQAMLYAAGAFLKWDWVFGFQTITIRICQPRLDVFEVWECSREELLSFMEFVRERAKLAWNEDAPRTPSKKACQFCAGDTCPARVAQLDHIIDTTFEVDDDDEIILSPEDAERTYSADDLQDAPAALAKLADNLERAANAPIPELSTRALAFLLAHRGYIDRLFKTVHETLLERAEKGEEIPWFKLTNGRSKRDWKDEEQAIEFIIEHFQVERDDIAPPTLLTPAKAEKLLRTKTKMKGKALTVELARLIDTFDGKRTLALLKDDRPDVRDMLDGFDMEEDDG